MKLLLGLQDCRPNHFEVPVKPSYIIPHSLWFFMKNIFLIWIGFQRLWLSKTKTKGITLGTIFKKKGGGGINSIQSWDLQWVLLIFSHLKQTWRQGPKEPLNPVFVSLIFRCHSLSQDTFHLNSSLNYYLNPSISCA